MSELNPVGVMDALTLERLEEHGICEGCSNDLLEMCTSCLLKTTHDLIKSQAERIAELEGALQQIVDEIPPNEWDKWHHHHHYLFIARTALTGVSGSND